MYDEYHKTDEDIQAVIRYLQIHDPKNANRDYAIQFIDSMEGFGSEIARSDEALAEAVKKKLDEKEKTRYAQALRPMPSPPTRQVSHNMFRWTPWPRRVPRLHNSTA